LNRKQSENHVARLRGGKRGGLLGAPNSPKLWRFGAGLRKYLNQQRFAAFEVPPNVMLLSEGRIKTADKDVR
jgi:hypothetical protein